MPKHRYGERERLFESHSMDDARWNPERRGRPWAAIDTTRGKGGRDSEGQEETVSMIETALSREGECSSWDGARAILDALGGDLSRGKKGVFRGSRGQSRARDTGRERRSIFRLGQNPVPSKSRVIYRPIRHIERLHRI